MNPHDQDPRESSKQLILYLREVRVAIQATKIDNELLELAFDHEVLIPSREGRQVIERLSSVSTLAELNPSDFPYLQISSEALLAYKTAILAGANTLDELNEYIITEEVIPKIDTLLGAHQRLPLNEIAPLLKGYQENVYIKIAEDNMTPQRILSLIQICETNAADYIREYSSGNCGVSNTLSPIQRYLESHRKYAGVFAAGLAVQYGQFESSQEEQSTQQQASSAALESLTSSIRTHVSYSQYAPAPTADECAQRILGDEYPEVVNSFQQYSQVCLARESLTERF